MRDIVEDSISTFTLPAMFDVRVPEANKGFIILTSKAYEPSPEIKSTTTDSIGASLPPGRATPSNNPISSTIGPAPRPSNPVFIDPSLPLGSTTPPDKDEEAPAPKKAKYSEVKEPEE